MSATRSASTSTERRRLRIVGKVVLIGALVGSSMTAMSWSAAAAEPSIDISDAALLPSIPSSSDCTPDTLIYARSTSMDGATTTMRVNDGQAHVYRFKLAGGTIGSQVVTVPNWSMASAPDSELAAYGLPTRPNDPAALAVWKEFAAQWTPPTSLGGCTAHKGSSAYSGGVSSPNWAGGIAGAGLSYGVAEMKWTEPTFDSTCSGSAMSIWTGIGGWNSNRLLQAGVDNIGQGNSSNYAFDQILPLQGTEHRLSSNTQIPGGHSMYSYAAGNATTFSSVVKDYTNGQAYGMSYGNLSGNYDSSTAEWVTESPGMTNGSYFPLRRPSSGSVSIPYATANRTQLSSIPKTYVINQIRSGVTYQTSSFNGANAWSDTWKHC